MDESRSDGGELHRSLPLGLACWHFQPQCSTGFMTTAGSLWNRTRRCCSFRPLVLINSTGIRLSVPPATGPHLRLSVLPPFAIRSTSTVAAGAATWTRRMPGAIVSTTGLRFSPPCFIAAPSPPTFHVLVPTLHLALPLRFLLRRALRRLRRRRGQASEKSVSPDESSIGRKSMAGQLSSEDETNTGIGPLSLPDSVGSAATSWAP